MAGASDLASMVPGFDFLQGLFKNAGASLPGMGQWIAPTLNPEELEKRIQELKTVQFWLEQNARLLSTTIQALEVQRMTLSTLQNMNLPLAELGEALKIKLPQGADANPFAMPAASPAAPAFGARPSAPPASVRARQDNADEPTAAPAAPSPEPAPAPAAAGRGAAGKAARAAAPLSGADPMQWWGALTQQFTELAARAVRDAAQQPATDPVTKPAASAAGARVGKGAAAKRGASPSPDARGAGRKAAAPRKAAPRTR